MASYEQDEGMVFMRAPIPDISENRELKFRIIKLEKQIILLRGIIEGCLIESSKSLDEICERREMVKILLAEVDKEPTNER